MLAVEMAAWTVAKWAASLDAEMADGTVVK
jgi:hypothetical protein